MADTPNTLHAHRCTPLHTVAHCVLHTAHCTLQQTFVPCCEKKEKETALVCCPTTYPLHVFISVCVLYCTAIRRWFFIVNKFTPTTFS